MGRHEAEYIVYDNNNGDEIIAIWTTRDFEKIHVLQDGGLTCGKKDNSNAQGVWTQRSASVQGVLQFSTRTISRPLL